MGRVTAAKVVDNEGVCWKVQVDEHPAGWTGIYETHDDGVSWECADHWLVNRSLLEGLRAVIEEHRRRESRLWAVFNGYMGNGPLAVVVEAQTAEAAIARVRELNPSMTTSLRGCTPFIGIDRNLVAKPFELGQVIELG